MSQEHTQLLHFCVCVFLLVRRCLQLFRRLFWRPEHVKQIQLKELAAAGATLILAARQLSRVRPAAKIVVQPEQGTHTRPAAAAKRSQAGEVAENTVQPAATPALPETQQAQDGEQQQSQLQLQQQLLVLQRQQEQQELLQRRRERQEALKRLGLAGRLAPSSGLMQRLGLLLMVPLFAFYGSIQVYIILRGFVMLDSPDARSYLCSPIFSPLMLVLMLVPGLRYCCSCPARSWPT
jgi:hypothetical protein